MNRNAETVPARHETPDVTELRRLLAGASPLPWHWEPPSGKSWPLGDESLVTTSGDPVLCGWGYDASGIDGTDGDRALIAAAVNALPGLLGKADALLDAADRLAHMTEARNNARAERDALAAKAERVRALADEWTYNGEFGWDDGSHVYGPDCEGQALDYAAAKLRRALDEEPRP